MKLMFVIFLQAALITVSVSKKPKNVREKHCTIMNLRKFLKNGDTYKHRCDVYTCEQGNLKSHVHPCKIRLGYKQDKICLQWSKDGCCCVRIGCKDVRGVLHAPGTWYQTQKSRDRKRPKDEKYCKCKPGRQLCRMYKSPRNS